MGSGRLTLLIILSLLLLVPNAFSELVINEVLPRPIDDESMNEWIELYNSGPDAVDVAGYIIGDASDNDTLEGGLYGNTGTIIAAGGYAIITDDNTRVYDNFEVSSDAVHLYVDDSSIGNGLSNLGEIFFLYDTSRAPISQVSYGGATAGMSYSLNNGNMQEGSPSPGYAIGGQANQESNIQETSQETQEAQQTDQTSQTTQLIAETCDWSVSILLNKTVFTEDEFTFKIRTSKQHGDETLVSATAVIEDVYGNITKEYAPWNDDSATIQKTSSAYSPNLDPGVYVIKTNLETQCIDQEMFDNTASQLFVIQDQTIKQKNSSLAIESSVSNKNYKFGETILAKVTLYRGDTRKYAVVAYVEKDGSKASEETSLHLDTEFSELELSVPIKLKDNCNGRLDPGTYDLILEGFDLNVSRKIFVNSSDCDVIEQKVEQAEQKPTIVFYGIPKIVTKDSSFSFYAVAHGVTKTTNVTLWSYINSSVANKPEQKIQLYKKPAPIQILVTGASPGNYSLVIGYNDGNEHSMSVPIIVTSEDFSVAKEEQLIALEAKQDDTTQVIGAAVVSTQAAEDDEGHIVREYVANPKQRPLALYGIILVLGSLCTYFIIKQNINKPNIS